MSTCKTKNCGCTAACGCGDYVLTTPPVCDCDKPECNNGDDCPESFAARCTIYTGDTIANIGVNNGDNVESIIQRLALLILNPGCSYPDSACGSVVGFKSTKITTSSIYLTWGAVDTATEYQVEYRKTTSDTWLINPTTTDTKDSIGDLDSATAYYVRVSTICQSGTCYSLTLLITTK